MQPDLLKYWKFTRSVIAYPENNDTEFKIATKYNALIEFLINNPKYNKPGIPLNMLPEKTYDQFPGVRLFKKDSIYARPQTIKEAANNEALLVLTNNRPDVIKARFNLAINRYKCGCSINDESTAMAVYLLNNSSGYGQVRALSIGGDYYGKSSLTGSSDLDGGSCFLRVSNF